MHECFTPVISEIPSSYSVPHSSIHALASLLVKPVQWASFLRQVALEAISPLG